MSDNGNTKGGGGFDPPPSVQIEGSSEQMPRANTRGLRFCWCNSFMSPNDPHSTCSMCRGHANCREVPCPEGELFSEDQWDDLEVLVRRRTKVKQVNAARKASAAERALIAAQMAYTEAHTLEFRKQFPPASKSTGPRKTVSAAAGSYPREPSLVRSVGGGSQSSLKQIGKGHGKTGNNSGPRDSGAGVTTSNKTSLHTKPLPSVFVRKQVVPNKSNIDSCTLLQHDNQQKGGEKEIASHSHDREGSRDAHHQGGDGEPSLDTGRRAALPALATQRGGSKQRHPSGDITAAEMEMAELLHGHISHAPHAAPLGSSSHTEPPTTKQAATASRIEPAPVTRTTNATRPHSSTQHRDQQRESGRGRQNSRDSDILRSKTRVISIWLQWIL